MPQPSTPSASPGSSHPLVSLPCLLAPSSPRSAVSPAPPQSLEPSASPWASRPLMSPWFVDWILHSPWLRLRGSISGCRLVLRPKLHPGSSHRQLHHGVGLRLLYVLHQHHAFHQNLHPPSSFLLPTDCGVRSLLLRGELMSRLCLV